MSEGEWIMVIFVTDRIQW